MEQGSVLLWGRDVLLAVGWGALVLVPAAHRWCWFTARTCAMLLACLWAILAWQQFGVAVPGQLWASRWPAAMAGSPAVASIALVQFQAFSLFVASWQVEDGPRHDIPHVWLLPGLAATALAGPLGLIIHMGIRDIFKIRQKPRNTPGVP